MSWKEQKEDIRQYIETNQPEIYWDYRDELSEQQIEKMLSNEEGRMDIEEEIWEMNIDHICDLENELIVDVISHFDLEQELEEGDNEGEFKDFCKDFICVDYNIEQLLRNASEQVFFYDTGVETSGYGQTPAEYRAELRRIKRVLKITTPDHDKKIMQMILQASYGGQLVVYFMAGIDEISNKNKMPSIKFRNMNIAIIDTANGSGDNCFIQGGELTLPFDRDKIFYDESIKYNYSFAVCGMCSDWCSSTQWEYITEKARGKASKKSVLQIIKEQNAEYDRIYKSGKCSFGDMDITRHRHAGYVNEYPCGNRCTDCGTFWID